VAANLVGSPESQYTLSVSVTTDCIVDADDFEHDLHLRLGEMYMLASLKHVSVTSARCCVTVTAVSRHAGELDGLAAAVLDVLLLLPLTVVTVTKKRDVT
jgi:hypothetical protein